LVLWLGITNKVVKTISESVRQTGPDLGILPSGSKLYVARSNTGKVDVINTARGNLAVQIPTPPSIGIAIGPGGHTVYASQKDSNTVKASRADTNSVEYTVSGFTGPQGLTSTPDNGPKEKIESGHGLSSCNTGCVHWSEDAGLFPCGYIRAY